MKVAAVSAASVVVVGVAVVAGMALAKPSAVTLQPAAAKTSVSQPAVTPSATSPTSTSAPSATSPTSVPPPPVSIVINNNPVPIGAIVPVTSPYYGEFPQYESGIAVAGIIAPTGWLDSTGTQLCQDWFLGESTAVTDQQLLAGGIYPWHLAIFDAITLSDLCPSA